MKKRSIIAKIFILHLFFILALNTFAKGQSQTDVDRASHSLDRNGIPLLEIAGIGKVYHPGWVAIYALAYAGEEVYDQRLEKVEDEQKFGACIAWLKKNLRKNAHNLYVWDYNFDSTYNDVSIKAPWSSAFAQAVGIQALLVAYKKSGNIEYLNLAKKASKSLITPIKKGGFLFKKDRDIWFEEIANNSNNPSHILNGHMRALLALKELANISKDKSILSYFNLGMTTLYRWLPLYDTGYWLRYDLNPKKTELLFRFANPYGDKNYSIPIRKISILDPISKKEQSISIGNDGDFDGPLRLSGVHWGVPERVSGSLARRLIPVETHNSTEEFKPPHSYFYLQLPSKWKDNLRKEWFSIAIEYYDESRANLTVQQRSIAPGSTFKDMRDGDLHLTGVGHWRKWVIPLRTQDLGYWVGDSYAQKHYQYLLSLSSFEPKLKPWAKRAKSYYYSSGLHAKDFKEVKDNKKLTIPKQLAMLPIYGLDENGIVTQYQATKLTKFQEDGTYDPASNKGKLRYSPFIIALQLLQGRNIDVGNYSSINKKDIKRENALRWFLNKHNQASINGTVTYQFDYPNAYNDVATPSPWSSSFSQAYILMALQFADKNKLIKEKLVKPLIKKIYDYYNLSVDEGGIKTITKEGLSFYEEVPPNKTHVLNAHLISINELASTYRYLNDQSSHSSYQKGLQTLKEKLYLFDAGYWLKYDLNPKKELLLQFDWNGEKSSPLIDKIELKTPSSLMKTTLIAGSSSAFRGPFRLSGTDWLAIKTVDGKKVRAFQNGYQIRSAPISNGAQHNVFIFATLPDTSVRDYFDLSEYILTIHYKDVSRGKFHIKLQAINEGDSLEFIPLRGGGVRTIGDNKWKVANVIIRPQDLGWYVGSEYQSYKVEQLQRIANLTNDTYFYQYAERQRYYLKAKAKAKAKANKIPSSSTYLQKIKSFFRKIIASNLSKKLNKHDSDSLLYMSGDDRKNPLSIFKMPITKKIERISNELSQDAKTPHEKILKFMEYINNFKVGFASSPSPEVAIDEKIGACGSFTSTLLALSIVQGIPGRFINLHNYPKNNGHTVAELYYDNAWHLYDPTYTAFFSPKLFKGKVLSFDELRKLYAISPNDVVIQNSTYRPGLGNYTGPEIYTKANPAGVIGPNYPMFYPLSLPYGGKLTIDKKEIGVNLQGGNYVGAADINQNQIWTFNNLKKGSAYEFIIEPDYLGGDIENFDRRFKLYSEVICGGVLTSSKVNTVDFSKKALPVLVKFIANNDCSDTDTIKLKISHKYSGDKYRYMYINSYTLKKV